MNCPLVWSVRSDRLDCHGHRRDGRAFGPAPRNRPRRKSTRPPLRRASNLTRPRPCGIRSSRPRSGPGGGAKRTACPQISCEQQFWVSPQPVPSLQHRAGLSYFHRRSRTYRNPDRAPKLRAVGSPSGATQLRTPVTSSTSKAAPLRGARIAARNIQVPEQECPNTRHRPRVLRLRPSSPPRSRLRAHRTKKHPRGRGGANGLRPDAHRKFWKAG